MTIQKAVEQFKDHQRTSLKKRTQEGYKNLLERFQSEFCDREVDSIRAEELCRFRETCMEGLSRATRRLRYAQLRALFNFVIDTFEMNIKNPCCIPQLFKSFKNIQQRPRKILDNETVDEIICNSNNTRDRLNDVFISTVIGPFVVISSALIFPRSLPWRICFNKSISVTTPMTLPSPSVTGIPLKNP